LNGSTGQKVWSYPTGGYVDSSPCVGDLFGNGKLEVLVGSYDYSVYCLNAGASPSPGLGTMMMMIALVGVAALVIVVLAVVVYTRKKKP
jgi:outer membrane protein assembly factor BamB